MVLMVGFGGLAEIVQASYTDDRMGRAARAAARALSLNPSADACASIRSELRLAEDFDCGAEWELTVYRGVAPDGLPATPEASVAEGTGDLVLIRIGWDRDRWSFDGFLRDANADTDADADADADETVPMVAIGLARCEADLCGQGTP